GLALEEDARLTALFLWTLQSTAAEANGKTDEDAEEEADEEADDDEDTSGKAKKGFTLVYDVARRFAQPLGIHLDAWEGRVIETKKGVVRLLPVSERAEQLFGKDGSHGVADRIEAAPQAAGSVQLMLFGLPPEEKPHQGTLFEKGGEKKGRGKK